MLISAQILDRLAIALPSYDMEDMTVDLARTLIRDMPINLLHLCGEQYPGPYLFPEDKDRHSTSSKLAIVLNTILLEKYECPVEFQSVFAIPPDVYSAIWNSDTYKPKHSIIAKLMYEYDLNINFIYAKAKDPFTVKNN